jgi:hypothetical protein
MWRNDQLTDWKVEDILNMNRETVKSGLFKNLNR